MKKKNRLLVQFVSDDPFGGKLEELDIFETPDQAVKAAIFLMDEITIKTILINNGPKWLRIKLYYAHTRNDLLTTSLRS
jgi:hypothetical protein